MDQEVWFARMSELVDALHEESHHIKRWEGEGERIGALFLHMVDVLQHLTNSTSWNDRQLHGFDKADIRVEWRDGVAWRIE